MNTTKTFYFNLDPSNKFFYNIEINLQSKRPNMRPLLIGNAYVPPSIIINKYANSLKINSSIQDSNGYYANKDFQYLSISTANYKVIPVDSTTN